MQHEEVSKKLFAREMNPHLKVISYTSFTSDKKYMQITMKTTNEDHKKHTGEISKPKQRFLKMIIERL